MLRTAEDQVRAVVPGILSAAPRLVAAPAEGSVGRGPPTRMVAIGLAVGFVGAALTALPGLVAGSGGDAGGQKRGVLLILTALICYGFAINLARPLQQRNGALPVVWNALAVAVLLTAPLGLPDALRAHWSPAPLAALLTLGAFGTGAAYVLAATAAGRLGATRASTITFIMPVVAFVLGVVLRHEQVAGLSIAGAAICLTGARLIR